MPVRPLSVVVEARRFSATVAAVTAASVGWSSAPVTVTVKFCVTAASSPSLTVMMKLSLKISLSSSASIAAAFLT